MFKRVLIANRGEIAIRIIRACREMGIEAVAVYSTADKDQLHVKLADYAVCIGGPKSNESYLNIDNIISAAISLNCDAIHPGYGFLSENAEFVKIVESYGMKFIGPSSEVINLMGDKAKARELMIKNDVPTVPGSDGIIENIDEASKLCEKIGFPVLIKASAGGGGRGMRRVFAMEDLEKEFTNAKTEAINCFGNGDMYIEKLVLNPKHIEFQIIADSFGNTIHLGDRDCSIQRRNQKMIEEAPSVFLDDKTREQMGAVAVRAAKACNYENAGTIEFVVDENRNFYFIEMNTRIQVEHPVTEMVTGVDLIKEQLRVACGLHLSKNQEDIEIDGYQDLIFTGGSEASIVEVGIGGFTSMKALSEGVTADRASIPFDKERSGFVMGEGAAVIVLEELEHAKSRGAKIYGELVGYGVTCDANHITAPDSNGTYAGKAMADAIKDANIKPEDIDYINAHGTSTPLNDQYETLAVKNTFKDHAYKLKISSTKSMTGHLLGASGGIEAIISTLAVDRGYIPPTINYKVKDELCDLNIVPNKGIYEDINYVMSNSLGFGGHNASIIIKKWEK